MTAPLYEISDSDGEINESNNIDDFFLKISSPSTIKFEQSRTGYKSSPNRVKRKTISKTSNKDEEKKQKQEEKARLKEEKRLKNEEEKRIKAEKKKVADLARQLRTKECIEFITAYIDTNILKEKFGGELLNSLQNLNVKYVVKEQEIPNTITWERNLQHEFDLPLDNHIHLIWPRDDFISLMASNSLNSSVKELLKKCPNHKMTVIVYGMEEYLRAKKNCESREWRANMIDDPERKSQKKRKGDFNDLPTLKRVDVETATISLQLLFNVQCKFVDTNEDLSLFVGLFSKAVAELPYKLLRNKNQENSDSYLAIDSKDLVSVDDKGNGLSNLWVNQLCQFPMVGLDVAQAIASKYNTPTSLMKAYDECIKRGENKDLLLQDIQIRRGQGILVNVRRVGPELSKKISNFFNTHYGDSIVT